MVTKMARVLRLQAVAPLMLSERATRARGKRGGRSIGSSMRRTLI